MIKISIFLDINVLLSIAYLGEKFASCFIFELPDANFMDIYISNFVIRETVQNLENKIPEKLGLSHELISKTTILDDVNDI